MIVTTGKIFIVYLYAGMVGVALTWTERGNTIQETTCKQLADKVRSEKVTVRKLVDLAGHWVSERCETRGGPEYLLRKYMFFQSGRFHLFQFYFSDQFCHEPAFCLEARGKYGPHRRSWTIVGGTEVDYETTHMSVMAYTSSVVAALQRAVNSSCPSMLGARGNPWQPWHRYDVLSYDTSPVAVRKVRHHSHQTSNIVQDTAAESDDLKPSGADQSPTADSDETSGSVDCADRLEVSLNELQLMRIEERLTGQSGHVRRLLLGDVHADRQHRAQYRPQSYQEPLLNADGGKSFSRCRTCRYVSEGSEFYPPSLPIPALPPPLHALLPGSTWLSERCETRPYGMFLTRRLTFGASTGSDGRAGDWDEQFDYHSDPLCRTASFSVRASGRYVIHPTMSRQPNSFPPSEVDFTVDRMSLTVRSDRTAATVNSQKPGCGEQQQLDSGEQFQQQRKWEVGEERDVTSSGGCEALGISLRGGSGTVIPQLLLASRRHQSVLLLVGVLPSSDHGQASQSSNNTVQHSPRPTSFYPALQRCISAAGPAGQTAAVLDRISQFVDVDESVANSRPWRHVWMSSVTSDGPRSVIGTLAVCLLICFC